MSYIFLYVLYILFTQLSLMLHIKNEMEPFRNSQFDLRLSLSYILALKNEVLRYFWIIGSKIFDFSLARRIKTNNQNKQDDCNQYFHFYTPLRKFKMRPKPHYCYLPAHINNILTARNYFFMNKEVCKIIIDK